MKIKHNNLQSNQKKRYNARISFYLLGLLLTVQMFQACEEKIEPIDLESEEAKVLEVYNKITEYGSKGDWENYQYYWDKSSRLRVIHPKSRQWLNGWEEFYPVYSGIIDPSNTWTTVSSEITINISEDGQMAWGVTDYIFYIDSNPTVQIHTWGTNAFEKINGEWKIIMAFSVPI